MPLFSFSTLQFLTSLYTILLTASRSDPPGTLADSAHPASKTRGSSLWGEGPRLAGGALQHQQLPPAGTGNSAGERDPSATLSCASMLFSCSMQTDQKDQEHDLQPIRILPPTSPPVEMHFLLTATHCARICTPDLNLVLNLFKT